MKINSICQPPQPCFCARIVENDSMEDTIDYVKNKCNAKEMNDFINMINCIKRSHKFNNFELRENECGACIYVNDRFVMSNTKIDKSKNPAVYFLNLMNKFVHSPMCINKNDTIELKTKQVPELKQLEALDEIRKTIKVNARSKLREIIENMDPYNGVEGYEPSSDIRSPFQPSDEDLYMFEP